MHVTVEDGRATKVAGDPDHPITVGLPNRPWMAGSGGFAASSSDSRTSCSAAERTSFRVDTSRWDSTTRHAVAARRRRLDLPPHRVQILDDIDEPMDEPGGAILEFGNRICANSVGMAPPPR